MRRGHTRTEPQNTSTQRRKPWTGVVTWPRGKGSNSFLTEQMARFRTPTAMAMIPIHPRTRSINHPLEGNSRSILRPAIFSLASSTTSLSRRRAFRSLISTLRYYTTSYYAETSSHTIRLASSSATKIRVPGAPTARRCISGVTVNSAFNSFISPNRSAICDSVKVQSSRYLIVFGKLG